jgi:hypothetical protein
MVHWLAPGPSPQFGTRITDLNKAVDQFNLDGFMADFDRTGADWLIFTIGQNTGYYASPNSIIDMLCGPGHTSKRDLVLEIAKAVKMRGKHFIAYLPCEVRENAPIREGMGWTSELNTDQAKFQENYLKVIKEWAVRFGKNLDGWWFDGCYDTRPVFLNKYVKWDDWYKAARAGNPDAVITFNDGSYLDGRIMPIRPEHDYLSGELLVIADGKIRLGNKDNSKLYMPKAAYVEGTNCLNHVLLPIDGYWGHENDRYPEWANFPYKFEKPTSQEKMPPPVFTDELLSRFMKDYTSMGAAVTLNVCIFQEGRLGEETIDQLNRLQKFLKQ